MKRHRKNRTIRKGVDYQKLKKIWQTLAESGDWLHINEISRRTGINNVTVRWYIDHYLTNEIEEQKLSGTIRVRFIRLRTTANLTNLLRYLKTVEKIKNV